ncbi:MAG: HAAS signaling domain-containing protein [Actinoallomurus sp.]
MTATTATDQLIEEYLDRLATAARTLPKARREETLAEIGEHIRITLSQSEDQGEAIVRTILDRLGAPEDIAREAGADLDAASREATGRRVGAFEVVTVILLLIGGIVLPVLGWVIGAVLLWASARWTVRDKVIGTLVVPGGLGVAAWSLLFTSASSSCSADGVCQTSGTPAWVGLTVTVIGTVGPLVSAVYLLRRADSAR